ncbi:Nif11-like leader peptide family natural product precursor [Leptolyngbya sp. PCC 6406]|uniref:Nif11-like leader peptide family natural product precursor n=1 Tax=Leptolyngbya sp. PCC 6406 TaxID=1173264 RepID=UPI0002ABA2CA|nr:Nif11-like leader peptide family natural product precursor [Leptolyngbya sp. PCC 6406]
MPKEDVARLFRAAQSDTDLRQHLSTAPNVEAFIAMAAQLGYTFTEAEWREMTRFSVEELEGDLSEIPGI